MTDETGKAIIEAIIGASDQEQRIDEISTKTKDLQNQINNIISPVTEDAEVQNARVGVDGTSYPTLKKRLDTEITNVKEDLNEIIEHNIVNQDESVIVAGTWSLNPSGSFFVEDNNYYTVSVPIDISNFKIGTKIEVLASLASSKGVIIMDANRKPIDYIVGSNAAERGYIETEQLQKVTLEIPVFAKYIITTIRKAVYTGIDNFNVNGLISKVHIYTPDDFGAVGDGLHDDSDAIIYAFNSGENITFKAGKTYLLNQNLNISDKSIDLNGSTIKSTAQIFLNKNVEIKNGNLNFRNIVSAQFPAVIMQNGNNSIKNISFSTTDPCYYIEQLQSSAHDSVENCIFDGNAKINIWVHGRYLAVKDCVFSDMTDETQYSNHIKISSKNVTDRTSPSAKDILIQNCVFGYAFDNAIDGFCGCERLKIDNCEFASCDARPAIEIKAIYRPTTDPNYEMGTNVADVRECRDITITNCLFHGIGYTITSRKESGFTAKYAPVKNVEISNCIFDDMTFDFLFAFNEDVENVDIENIVLKNTLSTKVLKIACKDVSIRNFKNADVLNIVLQHKGECLVENVRSRRITIDSLDSATIINNSNATQFIDVVKSNGNVFVNNCQNTNDYMIRVNNTTDNSVVIARNCYAKTIFNTDNANGKICAIGNIYTDSLQTAEYELSIDEINRIL